MDGVVCMRLRAHSRGVVAASQAGGQAQVSSPTPLTEPHMRRTIVAPLWCSVHFFANALSFEARAAVEYKRRASALHRHQFAFTN